MDNDKLIVSDDGLGNVSEANEQKNSTAGVEKQQAGTGGSPVQPGKTSAAKKKTNVDSKKKQAAVLNYSAEEKRKLSVVKEIFVKAYAAMLENDSIPTFAYSDHNAVIDLTTAMKNGIEVYMPSVNRMHGADQDKTGESLCLDSPQALLLVVPVDVAFAAGVSICRFCTDPNKERPVEKGGFVCINGNGRIGYTLGLPASKRPQLYATLVEPDSKGYINIPRAMSAINEHQSQWKTQDKLQKKIMEDGVNADANLVKIRNMVNRGFHYQAACQLATLRPDRIKSQELEKGDMTEIFKFAKEAEAIRTTLSEIFGEGDDKTLKTKPFSLCICQQFDALKKVKGAEAACELMIEFLKGISKANVKNIKDAKKDRKAPGETRDLKRVRILNDLFNRFIGRKGIEID